MSTTAFLGNIFLTIPLLPYVGPPEILPTYVTPWPEEISDPDAIL